ncbi:MAG: ATP-binding protein [Bacillota bacterium]
MRDLRQTINSLSIRPADEEENDPAEASVSCPECRDRGLVVKNGEAHRCRCMKQKAIIDHFRHANITRQRRKCTLENFDLSYYSKEIEDNTYGKITYYEMARRALDGARQFVENSIKNPHARGLLFCGPVGSGKTFLASAIANALMDNYRQVLFAVVPDLLDEIKFTYQGQPDNNHGERELLHLASKAEVLILDDLGAHNYTQWTQNKLYSIINRRSNEQLPIIITTNLELVDLEEYLGERTTSRLVELCQVYRLMVETDIRYLRGRVSQS